MEIEKLAELIEDYMKTVPMGPSGHDDRPWSSFSMAEYLLPVISREREETIVLLRELCGEYGDNDWPDDLHLRDIIEKHLAKHLWSEKRVLPENGG